MNSNDQPNPKQRAIRLWPGVILAFLLLIIRYILIAVSPESIAIAVFGGLIICMLIVLWWLMFSRIPVIDRIIPVAFMILSYLVVSQIIDISIKTSMMGMMFAINAIPAMCLAFVAWVFISRKMSVKIRRISVPVVITLAMFLWVLVRTDGMNADGHHDLVWRWSKTAEERLLSQDHEKFMPLILDSANKATEPEWSGFRGNNRDGIVHGTNISTDWSKTPPLEMWRRTIGPGCSSFAVHGTLLYTQEQRGEFETVSCYSLKTGEPIWQHLDSTRFWDSHAGAGPRSTPTLHKGKVYTLGATGLLNVLDAYTGRIVWSHNAAADTKVKIPGWGYTSSPLVVDSVVLVAISGQILAYESKTGRLLWTNPSDGECYSSPHLTTINGVKQVLFMNKTGISSYLPNEGKILWNLTFGDIRIIQPTLIDSSDMLVDIGNLQGLKRISVNNTSGKWTVKEIWTSSNLKPNHDDIVVHKGYTYGMDMPGLECINIKNGERKWKGNRYGGQLLLLADQDLLLILSEKGELVLVKAAPDQFAELARFQAIEGKTWNHPVLVGDVLIVRNTEEMAAFRLPQTGS